MRRTGGLPCCRAPLNSALGVAKPRVRLVIVPGYTASHAQRASAPLASNSPRVRRSRLSASASRISVPRPLLNHLQRHPCQPPAQSRSRRPSLECLRNGAVKARAVPQSVPRCAFALHFTTVSPGRGQASPSAAAPAARGSRLSVLRGSARRTRMPFTSAAARTATPNRSLNRTRHGMAPGPRSALCHHPLRGPGAIPRRAG